MYFSARTIKQQNIALRAGWPLREVYTCVILATVQEMLFFIDQALRKLRQM